MDPMRITITPIGATFKASVMIGGVLHSSIGATKAEAVGDVVLQWGIHWNVHLEVGLDA